MAHIIKDLFSEEQINTILYKLKSSSRMVDEKHGRYTSSIKASNGKREDDSAIVLSSDIHACINKIASDSFSKTAKQSYIKSAKYSGFLNPEPNLPAHLDDNACSYTIDYQLSSNVEWDVHINGKAYTLRDNWAVLYDGENDLHWREKFPANNPLSFVHMIFFHFVEPEHWFFDEPHTTSEKHQSIHNDRLLREAPLLIKYGKLKGTENKYVG